MVLLKTFLLSAISVAAHDISCAPQIPPASCSAIAAGAALVPRGINCNVVTGVLGALKVLGGPASSFCSSYLGIPRATTISTTITPAASTRSVVVTVTSTTTIYAYTGLQKRFCDAAAVARVHGVGARAVPKGLEKFAAAEISSACSCLHLSPASTVVKTITAPTPVITQFSTTTLVSTVTTCRAPGGHCDCNNPGACCNLACSCNGPSGPVSTCL